MFKNLIHKGNFSFYEKLVEISKNETFQKFTSELIADKNKKPKKQKEEIKV